MTCIKIIAAAGTDEDGRLAAWLQFVAAVTTPEAYPHLLPRSCLCAHLRHRLTIYHDGTDLRNSVL